MATPTVREVVQNSVSGALAVVEADVREPVNLCTGVGTSMARLAAMICEQAGYDPVFATKTDAPMGVAYRVGDPDRFFGVYKPRISLEEGVAQALT